jgi:hypothetical protein
MNLLGLDPGGMTGCVTLQWDGTKPHPGMPIGYDQIAFKDMPAWLDSVVSTGWPDLIVVERFFITPRTVKYTRQPEALYVIGGTLFLADLHDIPVRMQSAADAKTAWPNERLKDWPVKGRHAKDALRHVLLATQSRSVYSVRTETQTKGSKP